MPEPLSWHELDKMWVAYWRRRKELIRLPAYYAEPMRAWIDGWLDQIAAQQRRIRKGVDSWHVDVD